MIVVDASVAVKWFLPEPGSEQAAALLEHHEGELFGPDLLGVEIAATLVRGANAVKSNRGEAESALGKFRAMAEAGVFELRRLSIDQLHQAAALAIDIGHPLKDCIYLTLAMELGCPLITADAKFAVKARGVYGDVRVLGRDGRKIAT